MCSWCSGGRDILDNRLSPCEQSSLTIPPRTFTCQPTMNTTCWRQCRLNTGPMVATLSQHWSSYPQRLLAVRPSLWDYVTRCIVRQFHVSKLCLLRALNLSGFSALNAPQQNICMTFVQCWTNVEDVGPTLYKCYTNVFLFAGTPATALQKSLYPFLNEHEFL